MRHEKQYFLEEIQEHLEKANGIVILRYSKFTANSANSFRAGVAKLGADVTMVPKRVLMKGAEKAGMTIEKKDLDGHIGLVVASTDPIEVAKYVIQFGKECEQAVEVIGGRFEGKLYNAADVKRLSELPSLPEMRAQFLGLLEAPMAQTLATVEAILCSVIHCLEQKGQQDSEGQQGGESQQTEGQQDSEGQQ